MQDEFILGKTLELVGAKSGRVVETIQNLWSGYGRIIRVELEGGARPPVIVKFIDPSRQNSHPRGWAGDISHHRKLKSYEVEPVWYQNFSMVGHKACRMARCYGVAEEGQLKLVVLEDLDHSGFQLRYEKLAWDGVESCIHWLAAFHGSFMGKEPRGLWEQGTYWHLQTRPEELEALEDQELKKYAAKIDLVLEQSPFRTIVHGDAKLANFCFSSEEGVAAVDFQYVGGGCGMKDLAYFVGSCLDQEKCKAWEKRILDSYFYFMGQYLDKEFDVVQVEKSWRPLYDFAWTDFHRFLKGWSPGHWKINDYSEMIKARVLKQLHEDSK